MENMNDYQIQDGDIRKVRRVEIRDDWDSPEQIVHPVSEEKVQEYLKNKSDKPMMLPKMVLAALVGLLVLYGIVHGICNLMRANGGNSSKSYASVAMMEVDGTEEEAML